MATIVGWGVEKVQRASWKEKNVNLHSNSIGKIQQLEIIVEMKIDFHIGNVTDFTASELALVTSSMTWHK